MESFFARYKNPLVLALVLMAQFVLLAVQVRPRLPGAAVADQSGVKALRTGVNTVVTPPEKALHQGGLSVRGIWSSYIDLIGVKQQNEALQAENQRLQMEQAALAEDARQGERLQELLAFKQHYVDTTVPAQVVGTGGTDHGRVLYIDKGAEDGIAADMPVITPDGIVGRVREVMAHTSQVLEISDPTSAAGVLLEQTRTRGILRGDNVGHAEIVNLMPDDRIQPGQLVLTSGGDQIFPRGLPVGVVDRVVPDVDNQPLVDVILKPAANLGRLEEVLVVTGTSATMSARSRHDLARSETTAAALKAAAAAKAAQAAEAAIEAQRASDILAQRLPSAANVTNPDAPDAAPGSSPATADSAAAPLRPPSALHADHYTPGSVPAADGLTPGARLGPMAEGTPNTERPAKTGGDPASSLPSPSVSPAFRAAHDAALAARPHAPTAAAAATPTAGAGASAGRPVAAAEVAAGAAAGGGGFVMRPLIRRVPVMNADGTPQLNADGTPAVKRIPVLNPDGTPVMHRVPIPAAAAVTPAKPVLNADGTVARPVVHNAPSATGLTAGSAPRPAGRPAAGSGTGSSSSSGASGTSGGAAPGGAAPANRRSGVPTQIVNDGPVTTRGSAPANGAAPAPRKRTPALVPDDGSRPSTSTTPGAPARQTAPQRAPQAAPQTAPQTPPQEQR